MGNETSKKDSEIAELYELWRKCEAYYSKKSRNKKPSAKAKKLLAYALQHHTAQDIQDYFRWVYTSETYWCICMRGGYTGLENLFRRQNVQGRVSQGVSELRKKEVPEVLQEEREYVTIQGKLGYFDAEGIFRPVVAEEINSWKK